MPGSDASIPVDSGCGTACTLCVDSAECSCAAYNGHEYRFCTTALSFANSKIQCAVAGMRLARVDTLLENAWLRSTGDAHSMAEQWIGIEDPNRTLNWQWTDGTVFWTGSSNGSAVGGLFSNWNPNNPSGNSVRNCASMQGVSSGTWLDRSCTSLLSYVCELY